jgi:hypothetical protein
VFRRIALDFFTLAPIEAIEREPQEGPGFHRFDETLDHHDEFYARDRRGVAPAVKEAPVTDANSLERALAEAFERADHFDAPLQQRLDLYLVESRRLLPDLEATYDQLVRRTPQTAPTSSCPRWARSFPISS